MMQICQSYHIHVVFPKKRSVGIVTREVDLPLSQTRGRIAAGFGLISADLDISRGFDGFDRK